MNTIITINLNKVSEKELTFIKDLPTVSNNEITLKITQEADYTGRILEIEDHYEMAAIAEDEDGNRFEISWIFANEKEDLDWMDFRAENVEDLRLL